MVCGGRDHLCGVFYGLGLFVEWPFLADTASAWNIAVIHTCFNVAVEILQVSEGKLEAHEYLNALKAGELTESAAFQQRFARYRAQYTFPEE